MPKTRYLNSGPESDRVVVIGGSSGSIPVLIELLKALPSGYTIPLVIILHRLKNVESDLTKMLSPDRSILEPEDKELLQQGHIYLAPQNYHLLLEDNKTFSLDYSELVHYSRPSIDVSFMSISSVFRANTTGILLSGANADGAAGLAKIVANGGRGLVQDPQTAECPIMPEAALGINPNFEVRTPEQIVNTLLHLTN